MAIESVDGLEAETLTELDSDGFRESFDSFYRREVRSVVGLAYVLSGSRSGAEDLAHEGFVAAYRQWERISSLDDPGAWVRRVVANQSVSAFRRRTAEVRALFRLSPASFELIEFPAESAHIWREVRRLPKRQAQAVVLRHVEGHASFLVDGGDATETSSEAFNRCSELQLSENVSLGWQSRSVNKISESYAKRRQR